MDLIAEILDTYDESRIEVLAMEGPIGDAARGGFSARSKFNGPDNEAIHAAASKILAEPELSARMRVVKADG